MRGYLRDTSGLSAAPQSSKNFIALLVPFLLCSLVAAQITRGTAATAVQKNGLSVGANFTASANSLVLACVMVDNGATPSQVTSITPALSWSKIGPTLKLSQTAALELWAGYTSSGLSAQPVTVNYTTASNAQDASLVLQSYANTASTSAAPLAGIGPNVATNTPNGTSPATVTVASSGHSNSRYVGCGGLDNETVSSFTPGAGLVTDGAVNDTIFVTSAIETASAITGAPANTSITFSHPPGRSGYLYGLELIDIAYAGSGSNPAPVITFSASPASITAGQTATLSWSTTNANSVSIDNGIGSVATSGSLIVSPSATTTYTLTATGAGGTVTSTSTVTVSATAPPPSITFAANPTSITTGQSSSLSWSTANATSVSIDNSIGSVATSGSRTVTPSTTTTYTLTATGTGGTTVSSVTVNVSPPAPTPPTVTFAASPTSVPAGQSSVLSWTSANATSVSINNGIGAVATSGSVSVAPPSTTTYTITATGAGGTTSAATTVNVSPGGGGGTPAPTETYLSFNGSAVVTIPNSQNLVSGAMTVELWIKPSQNGIARQIASQYVANNNMQWQLLRDATDRIQFKIRAANGNAATATSGAFATDLVWHHLAAVYNLSTLSIYGDGVLLVSQAQAGNLSSASVPICVASLWTGSVCNNSGAFAGGIDEFRLFNRALSLTEIQSGMNVEIAGNTSGLVGYWKFDEGGATQTAVDSSSGAHNAVLGRTSAVETYDPMWLPDTVAPTVAVTSPANGSSVSGLITLSANASDNVGVSTVQFAIDGANVGALLTSAPYSMSYNVTPLSLGSHIFSATAVDTNGNASASSTAATVIADTAPAVLSSVSATLITSATATINWTTNEVANSQVAFGTTNSYGSLSTLDPSLVLQHSQVITGLSPATLYHYAVYAQDAAGNLSVSTDRTFVTPSVAAGCSDSSFTFVTLSDNYSGLEGGLDRIFAEMWGFDPNIRFIGGGGDTTSYQRVRGVINTDLNSKVNCGASEFPFFPAAGNHDQETQTYMNWWGTNYATNWSTAPANSRLALQLPALTNFKRGPLKVLSSPTSFTNISNGTIYSFDYKNAHFLFINDYEQGVTNDSSAGVWDVNGSSTFDPTNSQLDWIEQDLQANTQPITFVFSHVGLVAPIYSSSNPPPLWSDHNSPFHTPDLAATLARHNVTAIYRGHDHAPSRELIDGSDSVVFKRDYWDVANDPNGATGTPSQWQSLQGPGRIWQVDSGSVYTVNGAYVITKVSPTQITFLIYQWSSINAGTTQLWDVWTVPLN